MGYQFVLSCTRVCITLLVALVLTSCGGESERTPEVELTEVAGSVFIVTRGAESIKLGLVPVAAYSESSIAGLLEERAEAAGVQRATIGPLVEEARRKAQRMRSRIPALQTEADAAHRRFEEGRSEPAIYQQAWKDYSAVNEQIEAAKRSAAKQEADAERLNRSLERFSPSFYFDYLPTPIAAAKTDADGRFVIRVPSGQRVALAARSQREVFGSTEEYHWLVWLTPSGATMDIMLSNDNMVTSGTPSSVLQDNHFVLPGVGSPVAAEE